MWFIVAEALGATAVAGVPQSERTEARASVEFIHDSLPASRSHTGKGALELRISS